MSNRSKSVALTIALASCSALLAACSYPAGAPKSLSASANIVEVTAENFEPSASMPYAKKSVNILGSEMAYVDEGKGPVVIFLHGNPTSSYLWRNIMPFVADDHRVIAPDLIGMGDSAKPDIEYTFADHARYLDAFIAELELEDVVLVVHDWGSALGLRFARLNEANVKGIAFMEAIVPPALPAPSLEAMGPQNAQLFETLRTPGVGEEMVLNNNFFVEEVLGKIGVATPLSAEVLENYRRPFPNPESRIPTLVWPRQIPIAGEPSDTTQEVAANGQWLLQSEMPKLMFAVTPGALMPPPVVQFLQSNLTNVEAVDLGAGVHFVQEDHPEEIGTAIDGWLKRNEL